MDEKETTTKHIVDLYYPSLMTFLVFAFADNLLRGIIQKFSVELLLYTIMWIFLVIQTTFAYIHIKNVNPSNYPTKALVSDCLDIVIAIYVCAAIGGIYGRNEGSELTSYLHLSIPFLILSINQFTWFVIVREFNVPAIFRISILFCGMLAASISEAIGHNFWNLVIVVTLIALLGILRAINKAPEGFNVIVTRMWEMVKKKIHYGSTN